MTETTKPKTALGKPNCETCDNERRDCHGGPCRDCSPPQSEVINAEALKCLEYLQRKAYGEKVAQPNDIQTAVNRIKKGLEAARTTLQPPLATPDLAALERARDDLKRMEEWREGKGGILPYDFIFGTDKRDTLANAGHIETIRALITAAIAGWGKGK